MSTFNDEEPKSDPLGEQGQEKRGAKQTTLGEPRITPLSLQQLRLEAWSCFSSVFLVVLSVFNCLVFSEFCFQRFLKVSGFLNCFKSFF